MRHHSRFPGGQIDMMSYNDTDNSYQNSEIHSMNREIDGESPPHIHSPTSRSETSIDIYPSDQSDYPEDEESSPHSSGADTSEEEEDEEDLDVGDEEDKEDLDVGDDEEDRTSAMRRQTKITSLQRLALVTISFLVPHPSGHMKRTRMTRKGTRRR